MHKKTTIEIGSDSIEVFGKKSIGTYKIENINDALCRVLSTENAVSFLKGEPGLKLDRNKISKKVISDYNKLDEEMQGWVTTNIMLGKLRTQQGKPKFYEDGEPREIPEDAVKKFFGAYGQSTGAEDVTPARAMHVIAGLIEAAGMMTSFGYSRIEGYSPERGPVNEEERRLVGIASANGSKYATEQRSVTLKVFSIASGIMLQSFKPHKYATFIKEIRGTLNVYQITAEHHPFLNFAFKEIEWALDQSGMKSARPLHKMFRIPNDLACSRDEFYEHLKSNTAIKYRD
jgi:hypothetical protein